MGTESSLLFTQNNNKLSAKYIAYHVSLFILLLVIFFHLQSSLPTLTSTSWLFIQPFKQLGAVAGGIDNGDFTMKLRDSVTFFPLKDLRFSDTPMKGNTWFMSSLNDTYEENEAVYLYFPSPQSKSRLLCIKGNNTRDGTKNSYALAWQGSLPENAKLLRGLSYISESYYNHDNLWHGLSALSPFVSWSLKTQCLKPQRWVLFHRGEHRTKMGQWLQHLMNSNYGDVGVEKFEEGDTPYCFDKAVVMRHELGNMGQENKLKVFDQLRCKAREVCGLNPEGRGKEVNEKGVGIIRLTLFMRRGSRSFKDPEAVTDIFDKECAKVEGCLLSVSQSEDLSFCNQVRVMTNSDIMASPHGAQLTNMLFMDRGSSVMEFFPKGFLEYAGNGQYAYHWMAKQSGMTHQGAWWEPMGEECQPKPKQEPECFFDKEGQVGHNETYFAEWAGRVINQVKFSKLEQNSNPIISNQRVRSTACSC